MSDFDESKITRDEHGRFAGGGLGGFAAKHTGKLEGYAASKKSDLHKWTATKLPRSPLEVETPWEKHSVEKHLVDLAFVNKNAEKSTATGDLVLSQHGKQLDDFYEIHNKQLEAKVNALRQDSENVGRRKESLQKEVEKKEKSKKEVAEEWSARAEKGLQNSKKRLEELQGEYKDLNKEFTLLTARQDALRVSKNFANDMVREAINYTKSEAQTRTYGSGMSRGVYSPVEHMSIAQAAKISRYDLSKVHVAAEIHPDGSTSLYVTAPHEGGEKTMAFHVAVSEVREAKGAVGWGKIGARAALGRWEKGEPVRTLDIEHPPDAKGNMHPKDVHLDMSGDAGTAATPLGAILGQGRASPAGKAREQFFGTLPHT